MKIFAEIDDKKTRKNVREFLRSYRNIERLIGSVKVDFNTMTIIKGTKYELARNSEIIELKKTRDSIIYALKLLSKIHFQILYYSYCYPEKLTIDQIGEKLGYSGRTIERKKSVAVIEFAEAYNSGELLSYKK
ncbi:transcriptional regulator [Enterococcus hirae]|nr:transcriptional regulator [Enterococcus hirae]EMF0218075.1 transcriptional regulator [Enterococcus hirae]EMF0277410.1 transcriptional regulator [Enterococcus hirae]EMF0308783.1 transcriptional regulator [Enterococcus hirae]QQU12084.1 transcriptional regulator [Enterococcus hirae]